MFVSIKVDTSVGFGFGGPFGTGVRAALLAAVGIGFGTSAQDGASIGFGVSLSIGTG